MEGIAKAKAAGVYKGRKPSVPVAEVRKMKATGMGVTAIADKLGISRMSVYRALVRNEFLLKTATKTMAGFGDLFIINPENSKE